MNKSADNYGRLMKLLNCEHYDEALAKVDRVRRADQFLQEIKEMTKQCEPNEEPGLAFSWKIIKKAVSHYYAHNHKNSLN